MTQFKVERVIIYIILSLAIILSLIQFLYNRSLWLDEALLALNIIDKDPFQLLLPLDHAQVAPILFLQIVNFFSFLLPNTEYGLRLAPLLFYWISLYLFYQTIKIQFKNIYTQIFALSLFIFNSTLIYFSSELKQYMSDVTVTLSFIYVLTNNWDSERKKYSLLAIVGTICIFLSNISVIILSVTGIHWLYSYFIKKSTSFKYPFYTFALLGTVFIFYYFVFIYKHPTEKIMLSFWTNANAFFPNNILSSEFYLFLWEKIGSLFSYLLGFKSVNFLMILFYITGLIVLIKSRATGLLILLLTPIVVHFILSGLKLYPFHERLVLYTCPLIIITISYGFNFFLEKILSLIKKERYIGIAFTIPLIFIFYFVNETFPLNKKFPYENEEIKKSLNFISKNIKENDKIYVYSRARKQFAYYEKINFFTAKNEVCLGTRNKKKPDKYIDEIATLNGSYWILFSHMFQKEEPRILHQLDSLGGKKIKSFNANGSSAYLYQLDFK